MGSVLTRRGALAVVSAAGIGTLAAASRLHGGGRRKPQVGIQLYMVGEAAAKDLPGTLAALKRMGVDIVELGDLVGRKPEEMGKALRDAGIQCTSVHVMFRPRDAVTPALSDPSAVCDMADALGARHVVAPMFDYPPPSTGMGISDALLDYLTQYAGSLGKDGWLRVADALNEKGARLAARGVRLGYHNHSVEFAPLPSGERPYDILQSSTQPDLVDFELDLGWVLAAGLDPVQLLRKYRGRISQVHLKDAGAMAPNTSLRIVSRDLGKGVGKWKEIFAEMATHPKLRYAYIEQEPPFTHPPLDAAADAYRFLRKQGLAD